MNELIMNFQEELLNEEIAWHNIETSYLLERTTAILKEAVEDQPKIIDVEYEEVEKKPGKLAAGVSGNKIVEVAKKIFNAIVDALKSIGNFFSEMFSKLSEKIKAWKNKASSAPSKCEVIQIEMPDVPKLVSASTKLLNAPDSESTALTTIPVVPVKVDNPKALITTSLGQISTLFNANKSLLSKAKSEGEKGKSEANKAKSGDSKALAAAGEKKKKVSLFGRAIALIFRGIAKILSAMANVYSKKAGKASNAALDQRTKGENDKKNNDKALKYRTKEAELNKKASAYRDRAKNESASLANNPFLLESMLVNEEVEDLAIIDEELEELENFLEDYED